MGKGVIGAGVGGGRGTPLVGASVLLVPRRSLPEFWAVANCSCNELLTMSWASVVLIMAAVVRIVDRMV